MDQAASFAGILGDLALGETHTSQLVLSSPWGAAHPGSGHPGLYVVGSGDVYVGANGASPVRLEAGDVAVLPQGSAHVLASAPTVRTVPLAELCAHASTDRDGNVVGGGGGSAAVLHTLCFRLESPAARAVASFAPELVVLRARGGEGWLTHVGRALAELSSSSDVSQASSVKRRLAEILFTTALRDALAVGGVAGPCDRAVAAAVLLIHAEPARPWTASMLARHVGLSRSSFCARFAEAMGCGPARHLQRVRMEHAAYLLRYDPSSIEATARQVGYASASAFSVAFRRFHGSSPARFARARNPTPGSGVS